MGSINRQRSRLSRTMRQELAGTLTGERSGTVLGWAPLGLAAGRTTGCKLWEMSWFRKKTQPMWLMLASREAGERTGNGRVALHN